MGKIKKVALIQGGLGAEKQVSYLSARAVGSALKALNISYQLIEADKNLPKNLITFKPDIAFLAVHGQYAEDGSLQGLLEYLKIPYTGSGISASAICMDKCLFKTLISKLPVTTPNYQSFILENEQVKKDKKNIFNLHFITPLPDEKQTLDQIMSHIQIPLPFVVKPSREGSTLGITICKNPQDIKPALKQALRHDTKILVEQYVKGQEVALAFMENKFFTALEIAPHGGFYDYKSKYESQDTKYILPARIKGHVLDKCKAHVQLIKNTFQLRSYGRADFIVDKDIPYLTEINTLPGLTEHSLLPKAATYDGLMFNDLISKILSLARLDYV